MRYESPLQDSQSPEKPDIATLWKEYGGKGKCPALESPVMQRLVDSCREYIAIVLKQKELACRVQKKSTDDENYFAPKPEDLVKQVVSESDIRRRQLHNDIAQILVGKSRSGMSEGEANNIADFACQVAMGKSIFEI